MKESISNDLSLSIIAQAIDEMKAEQGKNFSMETLNLAELERRTGISRARLRRWKRNGFKDLPHGRTGQHSRSTVLSGYTDILDSMLKQGITNSTVITERLQRMGYPGGQTTVKDYIRSHRYLVPAKRQAVDPQGNRGRRYMTGPGESYQMDWGFVNILGYDYNEDKVACFAMICHHCGTRYIEFFPNAKQENLFIGMIHSFMFMGIPRYVLTDNMKSVVIRRDFEGHPIWQHDYESFMKTLGFQTKLCKPRHPFTKGKVERLIRFVKDNFIQGRSFHNITELNEAALEWCVAQNSKYHKEVDDIPAMLHASSCSCSAHVIEESADILKYLCPERSISFDGFIEYEGRRFGVPYSYKRRTVRVHRKGEILLIYSDDLLELLVTYDVTWSRKDRFCEGQYPDTPQPEELPTAPVTTYITMLDEPQKPPVGFEKFDFDEEDDCYE